MVACTHEEIPQSRNGEHPITAILAVVAIIAAILLIIWARFEVHGTGDIEAVVTEEPEAAPTEPKPDGEREIDAAVTSNRFATGLSP